MFIRATFTMSVNSLLIRDFPILPLISASRIKGDFELGRTEFARHPPKTVYGRIGARVNLTI